MKKKNIIMVISVLMLSMLFSMNVLAETHHVEIDGQMVSVETFGDIEVIEPNDIDSPVPLSVSNFSFNIKDKTATDSITNTHSKWRVQTKATLRNYQTGEITISDFYKYKVSVMKGSKSLFSYIGKADNVYGGLTFSNVPTGVELYIQVSKSGTSYPPYDYMYGEGDTEFFE